MRLTVRNAFALTCITALVLLIVGLTALDSLAAGQKTKRVFILNSYHQGFTFSDNEMRGIDDAFGKSGIKVETYTSYMDMKRIPNTPQYFSKLKELIKEGYKGIHFDVVLACDNDALEFMRKYRDELFPGVPVVFTGINDFDIRMLDGRRDITGTIEVTDYAGTIRIALELHPATKNIVVVTDNTTTGKAHRSVIGKIRHDFPQSFDLTHISLGDMTLDELAHKLSKLNSDSIVLLLHHFVDRNGTGHSIKESTSLLAKSASVPSFVVNDSRIGFGTTGGHLISGYFQGETAAQIAVKILSGTDVRTIPVLLNSPNKYMFDYSAMQRFNIAESALPQGSIVIKKPVSMLDEYRPHLFTILGVFIILCCFVAYLLLEIRRRKRAEEALKESEERYRTYIEKSPDAFILGDITDGRNYGYVDCNQAAIDMLRMTSRQQLFNSNRDKLSPERQPDGRLSSEKSKAIISEAMVKGALQFEWVHLRADGEEFPVEILMTVIQYRGKTFLHTIWRDITERKRMEEALQRSEAKYRSIFENAVEGIFQTTPDGLFISANPAQAKIFGYDSPQELMEQIIDITRQHYVNPKDRQTFKNTLEAEGVIKGFEAQLLKKDRNPIWASISARAIKNDEGAVVCYEGTLEDITERKRAEEEKGKLQDQLAQAQKMEFIGRLAGGIAHDFNNMLNVILGYTQLTLLESELAQPIRDNIEEIHKAAEHSADLTQQLLAFARKQTVAPMVLELNETIDGMLKMLRRLIGEDIDLAWIPCRNPWQVNIDPVQIDQILANLMVNARDAIDGVGKVTIETENVVFDELYCSMHYGFLPGEYVMLAVSDTGCGMDNVTLAHVFDPFFTTKEMDKGTGLGLSTVYGIVKQNNGFINIYSEPGKGATFKICLPRYTGETAVASAGDRTEDSNGGSETVLLVEDEPLTLKLSKNVLEKLGYRILAAGTPGEAIRIAEELEGKIHLVITDVVMPEMNGRDLAKKLLSLYPNIKCLYMSGYTANVIAHHGVLDKGIHFIEKPFTIKNLAAKVREALERV